MGAITLVLFAIGVLFVIGMYAVIWFLRFIGNMPEGKETEPGENKGKASRR